VTLTGTCCPDCGAAEFTLQFGPSMLAPLLLCISCSATYPMTPAPAESRLTEIREWMARAAGNASQAAVLRLLRSPTESPL
jgi:hypothetical protein